MLKRKLLKVQPKVHTLQNLSKRPQTHVHSFLGKINLKMPILKKERFPIRFIYHWQTEERKEKTWNKSSTCHTRERETERARVRGTESSSSSSCSLIIILMHYNSLWKYYTDRFATVKTAIKTTKHCRAGEARQGKGKPRQRTQQELQSKWVIYVCVCVFVVPATTEHPTRLTCVHDFKVWCCGEQCPRAECDWLLLTMWALRLYK